ncbi:hypothetical protein ASPWEDRAFT_181920 [Aspergillus wentii DTO 134E9]|uniref:F-box domain-containing protein n=1 Tax=Aspergillus wentii DTO 134E9 TaxID=1073089 RepID=A0A1L9RPV1_ASPWE|nr:uncharacterized protein ASPWEDRAFT_181920 [Aspergillus wentii DTO 134E9]KAI9923882.1 hypothetical protein MW887_008187 [Aspergillus wentii]OJJ36985.1 hypothetical protein ASPWEDRAFT_181920 [Aspergillus wentii DTO 134E9]
MASKREESRCTCQPCVGTEAYIFRLPEEILAFIIELAAREIPDRHRERDRYSSFFIISLTVTCHAFNRIAVPLLYHTINIQVSSASGVTKCLHSTLKQKQTFARYCQELTIHVGDDEDDEKESVITCDIVGWSSCVKTLKMNTSPFRGTRPQRSRFLQIASRSMREITQLKIQAGKEDIQPREIMESVDMPSLRELSIDGLTSDEDFDDMDYKHGAAAFTSLTLSNYSITSRDLERLIKWPKALRHFHIDGISYFYQNLKLSNSIVYSTLLNHNDTLKTIDIGNVCYSDASPLFPASDFPELEALSLSRSAMEDDLKFSPTVADTLLAPKLKSFTLDCRWTDEEAECSPDFGADEEKWLRELIKEAITRKAALKKITIEYTSYWGGGNGVEYPWDRVDRLRNEMRPFGFEFVCEQPDWVEQLNTTSNGSTEDVVDVD